MIKIYLILFCFHCRKTCVHSHFSNRGCVLFARSSNNTVSVCNNIFFLLLLCNNVLFIVLVFIKLRSYLHCYMKQICVHNVFSWFGLCSILMMYACMSYYSIKNAFSLKSFKLIFKIDKNKIFRNVERHFCTACFVLQRNFTTD